MTSPIAAPVPADVAALRAQCVAARAAVAADPGDEAAAGRLFELVGRAARECAEEAEDERPIAPAAAEAARLLSEGKAEEAEILLRRHLAAARNDPDAMLLMAMIATQYGFPENAEKILRRSVEVHPRRTENWVALARVLHARAAQSDQAGLPDEALAVLRRALTIDPRHQPALELQTAFLLQMRRLEEAASAFEQLLAAHPENASGWLNYGYLLKTTGAFGEAVAAYRTAIALDPQNGTIWWALADLKLARLFPADIRIMEEAVEQAGSESEAVELRFALAAAYDQAKEYEAAARHLRAGNAARLAENPYDAEEGANAIDAAIRTYTPDFYAARGGAGEPGADPIFVLGMPRSGSTLLEQILSSHSAVEGTEELFAVAQIVTELLRRRQPANIDQAVAELPAAELQDLGRRYLELTRDSRKTERPRFTDKNPDNWRHVGLIRAMLPNAAIIDIRRNPLDCCFANYRQHFLAGGDYTYGFREVASRYRDYVRLMRHFDGAAPGAVHRVIYEDLVDDTEGEVRRLLAYLGLPFEESCLRFFETDRAILTPSSEQVRQPINRAGLGKSARYEPWLGELKDALGDVLTHWRT